MTNTRQSARTTRQNLCAEVRDGRPSWRITGLHDGQFAHARHAQIARRVILPQPANSDFRKQT
jgi:hypothetical protein